MPLPSEDQQPWAIGVRLEDVSAPFRQAALGNQHGVATQRTHPRAGAQVGHHALALSGRDAAQAERGLAAGGRTGMGSVEDFFRWLADAHGINFSIAYDAYERARFLRGLWTTVWLSIASGSISIVIGLAAAALLTGRSRLLRAVTRAYVEVFRNTPPLVQLLFFYFAVGGLLPTVTDSATAHGSPLMSNLGWALVVVQPFRGSVQRRNLSLRSRGCAHRDRGGGGALGYTRDAGAVPRHAAARATGLPAGAGQQSGQSRQDDLSRLRDRGAGTALLRLAGLGRQYECSRDDERAPIGLYPFDRDFGLGAAAMGARSAPAWLDPMKGATPSPVPACVPARRGRCARAGSALALAAGNWP